MINRDGDYYIRPIIYVANQTYPGKMGPKGAKFLQLTKQIPHPLATLSSNFQGEKGVDSSKTSIERNQYVCILDLYILQRCVKCFLEAHSSKPPLIGTP